MISQIEQQADGSVKFLYHYDGGKYRYIIVNMSKEELGQLTPLIMTRKATRVKLTVDPRSDKYLVEPEYEFDTEAEAEAFYKFVPCEPNK